MPVSGEAASGWPSAVPVNKVAASALAGALTVVAVWLLGSYAGIQIPPTVQNALIVLVTFAIGWLTPPGAGEAVLAAPFPAGQGLT